MNPFEQLDDAPAGRVARREPGRLRLIATVAGVCVIASVATLIAVLAGSSGSRQPPPSNSTAARRAEAITKLTTRLREIDAGLLRKEAVVKSLLAAHLAVMRFKPTPPPVVDDTVDGSAAMERWRRLQPSLDELEFARLQRDEGAAALALAGARTEESRCRLERAEVVAELESLRR